MKCQSFSAFFETISNRTRMKIIEALISGPMNVGEICKRVNEEQSKVSHNLRILKDCSVVDVKTKGRKRIYSLNKNTIIPLIKLVKRHVSRYCKEECLKRKKTTKDSWRQNLNENLS